MIGLSYCLKVVLGSSMQQRMVGNNTVRSITIQRREVAFPVRFLDVQTLHVRNLRQPRSQGRTKQRFLILGFENQEFHTWIPLGSRCIIVNHVQHMIIIEHKIDTTWYHLYWIQSVSSFNCRSCSRHVSILRQCFIMFSCRRVKLRMISSWFWCFWRQTCSKSRIQRETSQSHSFMFSIFSENILSDTRA